MSSTLGTWLILTLGQKSELFNDELEAGVEVVEDDAAVLEELNRAEASPVPLDMDDDDGEQGGGGEETVTV